MHELAVTRQLLNIVLEEASAASISKVEHIKLVLGHLRGFVPDSIQFYFEYFSAQTIAEKAELEIIEIKPKAKCEDCLHEFTIEYIEFMCPECGSLKLEILQGNEFYLETISGD